MCRDMRYNFSHGPVRCALPTHTVSHSTPDILLETTLIISKMFVLKMTGRLAQEYDVIFALFLKKLGQCHLYLITVSGYPVPVILGSLPEIIESRMFKVLYTRH